MIAPDEEFFQIKKITRDLARSDATFATDFQLLLDTFNFQELVELLVQYCAVADVKRPLVAVGTPDLQKSVQDFIAEFLKKGRELCKSIANNVEDEKWQAFSDIFLIQLESFAKEKDLLKQYKLI